MTFSLDSDEKNINTMSKHLDSHVHKENMKRVQRSKTNLYKNNQNKDLFCEICIFESFSIIYKIYSYINLGCLF